MKKEILLFFTLILVSTGSAQLFSSQGKVAIINLDGTIQPSQPGGFSGATAITPESVRNLNDDALSRNTDAIIYEWNSGGGAVVASKEIKREIESVERPTICRFRDVAASGAYYASLGCDRVVADPASITGSIGVKSSYLEYSGALDKLGVEYVNITSGRLKDIGSPYRNATDQEKQILQNKTDKIHNEFVGSVSISRNLSSDQREQIETGEIFLGERAKNLGLVDELGGRETAVESAEELVGEDLKTVRIESSPGFSFLSLLGSSSWVSNFFDSGSPLKAKWR